MKLEREKMKLEEMGAVVEREMLILEVSVDLRIDGDYFDGCGKN